MSQLQQIREDIFPNGIEVPLEDISAIVDSEKGLIWKIFKKQLKSALISFFETFFPWVIDYILSKILKNYILTKRE